MSFVEAFDERLKHIEAEVRRIADSLDLLIRIDERQQSLLARMGKAEDRLDVLERTSAPVGWAVNAWHKAWWIVAAALLAFGFNTVREAIAAPSNPAISDRVKPAQVH
jgi:hypothetical protein